jgi:ribosomal protein L22
LVRTFAGSILPGLLDSASSPLLSPQTAASATATLARTVKQSLLIAAHIEPEKVDKHADVLIDELFYQAARPLKRVRKEGQMKKRVKADEISTEAKAVLDAVLAALAGDEELKRRWIRFGELRSA